MKRKLLLIMPNFFDYPQAICEELEKMGYEVDCFDDRPSTNGMVKAIIRVNKNLIGQYGVMSNVRFDELELMLMAMFEQPTLKDTIQVLLEVQPLVAEDAEMAALVQQTIPKMQRLTEPQFKGLELEWHRPEDDAGK